LILGSAERGAGRGWAAGLPAVPLISVVVAVGPVVRKWLWPVVRELR